MSNFLKNANNWLQLDIDCRRGLVDSSIENHDLIHSNVSTDPEGIELNNGIIEIPSLFRYAPPVPHSGGQTSHQWFIVLETSELTNLTMSAKNPNKGFRWNQTQTETELVVGGKIINFELPSSSLMIFQQNGVNAGNTSSIYTQDKQVKMELPNSVVFGGMVISGEATIKKLRIGKGLVVPELMSKNITLIS